MIRIIESESNIIFVSNNPILSGGALVPPQEAVGGNLTHTFLTDFGRPMRAKILGDTS